MATENISSFAKKLMLLFIFLQVVLLPALAAVDLSKEAAKQKIPDDAVQWITVVTSPWPTYTFGVLFFVILMGILMGFIIYQALSKSKIFEEGMGGAKNGVQIGITAILTLIIIKFMPFSYYVIIAALLVLLGVFLSMWTLFEAASKYTGAEGKWKNGFSAIGMGIVLSSVGYFLLRALDQFKDYGIITTSAVTDWPGAIAWIGIVIGIIVIVAGTFYIVSGFSGGGGGAGGGTGGGWFGGGGAKYENKRQINDVVNARKYNTQIRMWAKEMERTLAKIAGLINTGNTSGAKKLTTALMVTHTNQLKNLKALEREANDAMKKASEIEGVEPTDIARWESAAEQLTNSIDKIVAYEERLELQVGNGLHLLMTEFGKPTPNPTTINNIIGELRTALASIETEGLKVEQVSERVEQVALAVEGRMGAPAGPLPAGGRMHGP